MSRRDTTKKPVPSSVAATRLGFFLRTKFTDRFSTFFFSNFQGTRLTGGDLNKNSATTIRRPTDSLDLENFLQPRFDKNRKFFLSSKTNFFSSEKVTSRRRKRRIERPVSPKGNFLSANKKSSFFSDAPADWLEKSMTQIDLFSRKHRGMLASSFERESQMSFVLSLIRLQKMPLMNISTHRHPKPNRTKTRTSEEIHFLYREIEFHWKRTLSDADLSFPNYPAASN